MGQRVEVSHGHQGLASPWVIGRERSRVMGPEVGPVMLGSHGLHGQRVGPERGAEQAAEWGQVRRALRVKLDLAEQPPEPMGGSAVEGLGRQGGGLVWIGAVRHAIHVSTGVQA